jgi:hypothetical protein
LAVLIFVGHFLSYFLFIRERLVAILTHLKFYVLLKLGKTDIALYFGTHSLAHPFYVEALITIVVFQMGVVIRLLHSFRNLRTIPLTCVCGHCLTSKILRAHLHFVLFLRLGHYDFKVT